MALPSVGGPSVARFGAGIILKTLSARLAEVGIALLFIGAAGNGAPTDNWIDGPMLG